MALLKMHTCESLRKSLDSHSWKIVEQNILRCNPTQFIVAFHIKTTYLICTTKQITGFYITSDSVKPPSDHHDNFWGNVKSLKLLDSVFVIERLSMVGSWFLSLSPPLSYKDLLYWYWLYHFSNFVHDTQKCSNLSVTSRCVL